MASTINSNTTDGVIITPDTSGEIALQASGTTIATVSSTGIDIASGKNLYPRVPAFRAHKTSDQSISSSTWTKVTFDTEDFDTNSNFASSTFTPTVAGYYLISSQVRFEGTNHNNRFIALYKNGSFNAILHTDRGSVSSANVTLNGSTIAYCNGSTDYLEIYGNVSATSPKFGFSAAPYNTCIISGHLVSV